MMGRGTVRNRYSFIPKIILEISASSWFYYKNKTSKKKFNSSDVNRFSSFFLRVQISYLYTEVLISP